MDLKGSGYWKFVGVFISLVALGTGAFILSIFVQRGSLRPLMVPPSPSPEQKPDEIAITKLPNGDQLVENKTAKFRIEIPGYLQIDSEPVSYNLKAFTSESEGANVSYEVNTLDNPSRLTLERWLKQYRKVDAVFPIQVGSVVGTAYSRPVLVTDENIPLENSEEFLVLLPRADKIIQLSCTAIGPNYKNVIKECREKVQTFVFSD